MSSPDRVKMYQSIPPFNIPWAYPLEPFLEGNDPPVGQQRLQNNGPWSKNHVRKIHKAPLRGERRTKKQKRYAQKAMKYWK